MQIQCGLLVRTITHIYRGKRSIFQFTTVRLGKNPSMVNHHLAWTATCSGWTVRWCNWCDIIAFWVHDCPVHLGMSLGWENGIPLFINWMRPMSKGNPDACAQSKLRSKTHEVATQFSACCTDGEYRTTRRRLHGGVAVFSWNRRIPLSPACVETNTGSLYEGEFPCCMEKKQSNNWIWKGEKCGTDSQSS